MGASIRAQMTVHAILLSALAKKAYVIRFQSVLASHPLSLDKPMNLVGK